MSTCQNDVLPGVKGRPFGVTSSRATAGTQAGNSGRTAQSSAAAPPRTRTDRTRPATAVLVADNDAATRGSFRAYLESVGCKVVEAANGQEAIQRMSERIDVALVDLRISYVPGLECLRYIRKHFPDTQVIVTSGRGHIRDAVAAMNEGAVEYLCKPCQREELVVRVRQAAKAAYLAGENRRLVRAVSCPFVSGGLAGSSAEMRAAKAQIKSFAQLDSAVLISGLAGTGKTIAAQLIHAAGPRAARPFVSVNCAALPRDQIEAELFGHVRGAFAGATGDRLGRAEIANGGSLLIDEIGDLPLELQPRLLSLLRENTVRRIGSDRVQHVDVRIIAVTGQDLGLLCRQGRFREDLFFRINVLSLHMPALKEHRSDLIELAREILRRIARRRNAPSPSLADSAAKAIEQYDWPGNVREMEAVLEQAVATSTGPAIRRKDLMLDQFRPIKSTAESAGGVDLAGMPLAEIERIAILETLQACGGNKVKTARQLGVSEKTIYNKLKQYNLTGKV